MKGGKWVFGWVLADASRRIIIPPQAWEEYGFMAGMQAVFLPGSSRSGGFAVSSPQLLKGSSIPLASREIARSAFAEGPARGAV